ncbi:MAG: YbjN domain-containing protein [Aliidiomarina sp.]|uniref:YbjN domain-containing protein n=1 Tax=Aliidiomarina sp. TaxID=1872439 RepID=UPI0025C20CE7|nr:YbjN domain-containing protein [Aliidiomarina sp.]MCH8500485.1 YbjN domain-containing protein [Aliidiomarina sp.]
MQQLLRVICVSLFFLSVSPSATAEPILESTSVEAMLELMKSEGYAVSIDDDGDILWKIEGYNTYIIVAKNNEMAQFFTVFTESNGDIQTRVNDWNRSKSYSRSYWTTEGHPVLELDLDFAGGITERRVKDFLMTARYSFLAWLNDVVM